MKKTRLALLVCLLSLLFILIPEQVQAEARSIYVGDIIELRISTQEFGKDELTAKFKDFEIVRLAEERGGYLLTLRSFEPGEKKVRLGNKEIVITVRSTLDEIERDGLFEGDLTPVKTGFRLNGQYAIYALLLIFLLSGGAYYYRRYFRKKTAALSPHEHFTRQMQGISADDSRFFVKLTFCFKLYLESACSCRIRGKTTAEIEAEIGQMPVLQETLPEIIAWLEESDRLKFSGVVVFRETRQELQERLVHLVGKIDALKGSEP